MNEGLGLTTTLLVIGIYFFPWIVAGLRKHHNRSAIAVANLIFGWTIIGWGILLCLSLTEVHSKPTA